MNKKFSTLVAGLFLAGTLPVGAIHTENGEVPYRTDLVKSAVSSYHCNGVNSIDETLKSASNLNGNLNCSKELEHYAS
ncbi:hypothetical protein [Parabacteroides merdae]|uniref:hypothetical protein n=1 Tax=Parabacteroides merdae TaxID=46503 RepID=UPI0036F44EF2